MTILLIILAIIVLILILPIGASVGYVDGIFSLAARVLFFDIKLLPKKEKPEKKEKPSGEKKEKKFKKPKKRRPPSDEPKPKPTLEDILSLVKLGLDALSRFRRKLVINDFMLHFTAADEDPYTAAMTYGYVNSVLGALLPQAERAFNVRRSDVKTAVDFETTEMTIDFRTTFTVTLAKCFGVVLVVGWRFMKLKFKQMKDKAIKEAQEERTDKDGTAGSADSGGTADSAERPDGGAYAGQHVQDQGDGGC